MSLLHEARNNIRRRKEQASQKEALRRQKKEWPQQKRELVQEERNEQQKANLICKELRSESERLLIQFGADVPANQRDKTITALVRLIEIPSAMLIYKTKPSEVFKRKEISSNLNGNEE